MNFKTLFMPVALSSFIGLSNSQSGQQKLREWALEMHAAQIELLKIDWGQPGFCTEWDRDYDPKSRSCGKKGKLIERRYSDE
jgi:hypothetical protein